MTNTFLKIETIHNEFITFSVDALLYYKKEDPYGTQITLSNNEQYYIKLSETELRAALNESYCMVKDVVPQPPLPDLTYYPEEPSNEPEQTVLLTESEQAAVLPELGTDQPSSAC